MLVVASYSIHAQSLTPEVVASSGESFTSSTIYLDWTLGELVTETFSGNVELTQGFHQPTITPTSIDDLASSLGTIKVYPNPTSGNLFIEREKRGDLQLMLWDMKGSVVMQVNMSDVMQELDLSQLTEGIYILRMSDGQTVSKSIKIKKM